MKDIMNVLSKNIQARYPDIDCGGCCVVAAHVAKNLSKYTEVEIQAYDDDVASFKDLKEAHPSWLSQSSFDHVFIRFRVGGKWRYFDASNGVTAKPIRRNYVQIVKGSLTLKEATSLANHNQWNKRFNIATNRPNIRRLITRFFNKHEEKFKKLSTSA